MGAARKRLAEAIIADKCRLVKGAEGTKFADWLFIVSDCLGKFPVLVGREAKLGFKTHSHMLRHACGYGVFL
jgi:hypothetical protein